MVVETVVTTVHIFKLDILNLKNCGKSNVAFFHFHFYLVFLLPDILMGSKADQNCGKICASS